VQLLTAILTIGKCLRKNTGKGKQVERVQKRKGKRKGKGKTYAQRLVSTSMRNSRYIPNKKKKYRVFRWEKEGSSEEIQSK